MYRLLTFLGAFLFLALLIGGRDYGQQRFGLRDAPPPGTDTARVQPAPIEVIPSAPAIIAARYEPTAIAEAPAPVAPAPLVPAPFVEEATAVAALAPAAEAEAPAPLSETSLPVRYVSATAINVRQGPSTNDAVIGRLTRGEAVSIVGDAGDGWVQVRIEGDGIDGFVAARLLAESDPTAN